MVRCPLCQQESLRIIAVITHGEVIRKLLRHLKRMADPPPMAPAHVRQEAFAWSSACPRRGCRRPIPARWLVGATPPLSGPAPAMPPLPARGGGMAVRRQCPPSASRCCPWAASLAMETCGTPTRFVAVSHAARSRSTIVASTTRPATARIAVCARGRHQAPSSLLLAAHSYATVCRCDSSHGPIVSPGVCQSGSEQMAKVGDPSPHARPARERPPAGGLRAAGRAHGQPPGAGVGRRPVAATTPRVHAPRDCGTIAFEMPIRGVS